MDPAKLAKLQQSVRIGGKGTPRRKVKKLHKSSGSDDKKLQTALKKLNVQPIQAIEEVNMFKEDGNVIHFSAPKVHAAVPSNTFAIYGNGEEKELTELVPGILNQLGPDSLASLRKLAESYQSMQKSNDDKADDEDDDDIPELVSGENFEGKEEDAKAEETTKADDKVDDDLPELVSGENVESKEEDDKADEKENDKADEKEDDKADEKEDDKADEKENDKADEKKDDKADDKEDDKA